MKLITLRHIALILGMLILSPASSYADDELKDYSKMTPSGMLEFEARSLKLLAGASWGSGTLHYNNRKYAVDLMAVSAGGLGYKEIKGTAKVYNLNRLEDFEGKYGGAGVGVTAGTKSTGAASYENLKNVVLILDESESKGAQLSLSISGFEIEFD